MGFRGSCDCSKYFPSYDYIIIKNNVYTFKLKNVFSFKDIEAFVCFKVQFTDNALNGNF